MAGPADQVPGAAARLAQRPRPTGLRLRLPRERPVHLQVRHSVLRAGREQHSAVHPLRRREPDVFRRPAARPIPGGGQQKPRSALHSLWREQARSDLPLPEPLDVVPDHRPLRCPERHQHQPAGEDAADSAPQLQARLVPALLGRRSAHVFCSGIHEPRQLRGGHPAALMTAINPNTGTVAEGPNAAAAFEALGVSNSTTGQTPTMDVLIHQIDTLVASRGYSLVNATSVNPTVYVKVGTVSLSATGATATIAQVANLLQNYGP